MCLKAPNRLVGAWVALALTPLVHAQTQPAWRHIGNAAVDLGLAGLATGPVARVWYSDDGVQLYARTSSGKTFVTSDFEQWTVAPAAAPPAARQPVTVTAIPEPQVIVQSASGGGHFYALGNAAYRSDDGVNWSNLTQYRNASLLGPDLRDLAASPRDPEELVIASDSGVWRSMDGGLSWTGLNQFLPNLPIRKIEGVPAGVRGLTVAVGIPGVNELEWAPGEKTSWRVAADGSFLRDAALKQSASSAIGTPITAAASAGNYLYAGSADGQIWSSADKGNSWGTPSDRLGQPVEAIYISARDPRVALAALGARTSTATQPKAAHVLRTMNGGIFWDDITANLPDSAVHGVVADPASGTVYAASDAGVFVTQTDLASAGRPTTWSTLSAGLPQAAATDVKLDAGGNQIFVALDGPGVYTAIAPHRLRDVRIVNAADYSTRAAAPGGVLSVIGTRLESARTETSAAPVLAASEGSSQIQVPFDATGTALNLSLQASSGPITMGLALRSASPAIFVDPDGSPLILDAESGVLLDRSQPARIRSKVQILATGLGRVTPDWPAGVAAPLSDPPRVQTVVKAYLNGLPLTVTQATLAPGYIGSYLVEVEIPAIVDLGLGDLFIEADGQSSNHVRVYLAQ